VSKKILLVEDNQDAREVLTELFKLGSDFEVVVAKSGEEAVRLSTTEDFCVILMDIGLPGMDGYEATQKIKDLGVKTPIVGLTAHAFSENRDRAKDVGMAAYETKPIRFNQLLDKLLKITEEHNAS
jgi:CheY-like chemotaxis protein